MASCDKKFEKQLMEAGNRLIDPPSSVEELLRVLYQVENFLSSVEQSPTKSMKNALSPTLKALVDDKLFSHLDADVRVAVASCLSEIMRITAPDAPYDDDQMKVIFELIISSFENLADKSSRSYAKRISILQTAAKVQSCVVMLDLECDGLIVEMFQHFLKAARDYHPENVVSAMETIMTLVLEESEEISLELLSPILASLKKGNEEAMAVSQKLAEKVLQNCATKVRPSLVEAAKSSGISFDDYSIVVASICQEASGAVNPEGVTDEHAVDEMVPTQAAQEAGSVISNGDGKDESMADSVSTKKQGHGDVIVQCKNIDGSANAASDNLGSEQIKPSEISLVDGDKEAETFPDREDDDKDLPVPPCENPSTEVVTSSENGKEINVRQENESSVKEAKPTADDVSERPADGASDSEGKTAVIPDTPEKESDAMSGLTEKLKKQSGKKVDSNSDDEEESLKQMMDKKKLSRRKATSGKDASKTSVKDDAKDIISSPKSAPKPSKNEHGSEEKPETSSKMPETSSKRKHMSAQQNASAQHGENLIGSRIKVWWPLDRTFYDGVIDSYDANKKKHLVLYDDGDQEILNLKREKWELIESEPKSDEEETADPKSPDGPSEMPEKKAKKNGDQSTKRGKIDDSAKRVGAASSKSKAFASKSGKKPKDDAKVGETSKTSSKPETESPDKGKDKMEMGDIGNKLVALASRLTGKSKNDETSKQDGSGISKSSSKSKQKASKSEQEPVNASSDTKGNSKSNASGKTKPGSSSKGENTDDKNQTEQTKKSTEASKASKAKGVEGKSGKKRKRSTA